MHCKICNELLNDYESTRKFTGTKKYMDCCTHCLLMSSPERVEKDKEENKFIKTIYKD